MFKLIESMYIVVAEKPSVASAIRSVLRRKGVKALVTSVKGHLIDDDLPEGYGWNDIDPKEIFYIRNFKGIVKDIETYKKLKEIFRKNYGTLVIATDLDPEGELIGYEILKLYREVKGNASYYKRMRFSSTSHDEIWRSWTSMDDSLNWNWVMKAMFRRHFDLITGAAFTRLLTQAVRKHENVRLISWGSCVVPNTLIWCNHEVKPISKVKLGMYVYSFNFYKNMINCYKVKKVFVKKDNVYRLETLETGKRILATLDHPFYTRRGFVNLGNLKEGDEIATISLLGINIKATNNIILTEDEFLRKTKELELRYGLIDGNEAFNKLKSNGLLPLRCNSKGILLAKLLGYMFGSKILKLNGNDHKKEKKENFKIIFLTNHNSSEEIAKSLSSLGFSYYKDLNNVIVSQDFSLLSIAYSLGNLMDESDSFPSKIPALFFKDKSMLKAWLSGFSGATASKPSLIDGKGNFEITYVRVSSEDDSYNLKKLMRNLSKAFKESGIKTLILDDLTAKEGCRKGISLKLSILGTKNVLKFLKDIGYGLNPEKEKESRYVCSYLEYKVNNKARSAENFEDWISKRKFKEGIVFEKVRKIKGIGMRKVLDVEVDETHNFFANGFLTHNCQTPTLYFITEREKQIQSFKPTYYWYIRLDLSADGGKRFKALTHKFNSEKEAREVYELLKRSKVGTVNSYDEDEYVIRKPLPLRTDDMLRDLTRITGLPAHTVLNVAEELYAEGYCSYPRTDTNMWPRSFDFEQPLRATLRSGIGTEVKESISLRAIPVNGKRDDGAHPPIYPIKPYPSDGSVKWKVWEYIARRFLANAYQSNALRLNQQASISVANIKLTAKGSKLVREGFYKVYMYFRPSLEPIPKLTLGQEVKVEQVDLVKEKTKPPSRLSEAELLSLMEKSGLGTDATRAEFPKLIVERGYAVKAKGIFKPTRLGLALIDSLKKVDLKLVTPDTRKMVEGFMEMIGNGKKTYKESLETAVRVYEELFNKCSKMISPISYELASSIRSEDASLRSP